MARPPAREAQAQRPEDGGAMARARGSLEGDPCFCDKPDPLSQGLCMPGVLGRPVALSPSSPLPSLLWASHGCPAASPGTHQAPSLRSGIPSQWPAHLRRPCFSPVRPLCSAGCQQLALAWHRPEPDLSANLLIL